MDWIAFWLSIKLGFFTVLILLPLSMFLARWLSVSHFRGKSVLEAMLAVPLVLPPTVVGYYLLVGMSNDSLIGQWLVELTGQGVVFHFSGLLIASIIVNIPFAVQPIQRAFEAIPQDIRDSAACCGMNYWRQLIMVEMPLAWPGMLTALVLTFAHTLGEFGVVLMVGGSIPGETRTIAISIYDRVQSFDYDSAGQMSLILLIFSVVVLAIANSMSKRLTNPVMRRHVSPEL
ncbi:MAG: molybdate ABC transporter permease subunit [Methylophilaceae bacterium]|nr:molybdate ABC transporter permease subunit [Methylophilaceae bacterium]